VDSDPHSILLERLARNHPGRVQVQAQEPTRDWLRTEGWTDAGLMSCTELGVVRFCESSLAQGAEVTVIREGSEQARVFVRGLPAEEEAFDLESTMDLTEEIMTVADLMAAAAALEPEPVRTEPEPGPDVDTVLGFLPPPAPPQASALEDELFDDPFTHEDPNGQWSTLPVLGTEELVAVDEVAVDEVAVDEVATCLDLLVPPQLMAKPLGRWVTVESREPLVTVGPGADELPATSWTPFSSLARGEASWELVLDENLQGVVAALERLHLGTRGRLVSWSVLELSPDGGEVLLVGGDNGRLPVARLYMRWEDPSEDISVCLMPEVPPEEPRLEQAPGPRRRSGWRRVLVVGTGWTLGLLGGVALAMWAF